MVTSNDLHLGSDWLSLYSNRIQMGRVDRRLIKCKSLFLVFLPHITTWLFLQTAPSLLIGLINMFMFIAPNATDNNYPVYGPPTSQIQYYVQVLIVLLSVTCVPWMLLVKPFILFRRNKKNNSKVS